MVVSKNPFFNAIAVAAGTMVALGGSTIVVSGIGIAVAKQVSRARKMKVGTSCCQCKGEGFLPCDVCLRTCVVRCRPAKSMSDIMRETKNKKMKQAPGQQVDVPPAVYYSCPACGTSGYQRCLNCLGDGRV
jgi:hypothetical protein